MSELKHLLDSMGELEKRIEAIEDFINAERSRKRDAAAILRVARNNIDGYIDSILEDGSA